jgi:very-short-patch-repair endonuclease
MAMRKGAPGGKKPTKRPIEQYAHTDKKRANNSEIREGMTRAEIDAAVSRYAEQETLYDQPFVDRSKVRVTGPVAVEAVPTPTVPPIDDIPLLLGEGGPHPGPLPEGEGGRQAGEEDRPACEGGASLGRYASPIPHGAAKSPLPEDLKAPSTVSTAPLRSGAAKPLLPEDLKKFARKLRKEQTDAEKLLWRVLRDRQFAGCKFRRQHPVAPYILDFYCHEARLAVELDGGQHNDAAAREKDARRTSFLEAKGIRVLRFWNHEVLKETEGVFEAIYQGIREALGGPGPHPGPLPEGEGVKGAGEGGRQAGEGGRQAGEGGRQAGEGGRQAGEGGPHPNPLPLGEGGRRPGEGRAHPAPN